MTDLTARLLSEDFEEALDDIYRVIENDAERECTIRDEQVAACSAAIRELHARLRTVKKYAAAPVDKGIPMHVYRAVCEQRDYELGEQQRMTHRYEVEALRNKELEEQLATAKAEGAAEAYEDIKAQAEDLRKAGGMRASLLRLLTEECVSRAAAIRKGIEAKEAGHNG